MRISCQPINVHLGDRLSSWLVVESGPLSRALMAGGGFARLERPERFAVDHGSQWAADMSDRGRIRLLRRTDPSDFLDLSPSSPFPRRWWDTVHRTGSLPVAIGDASLFAGPASDSEILAALFRAHAPLTVMDLAVFGFPNGVGTRPESD